MSITHHVEPLPPGKLCIFVERRISQQCHLWCVMSFKARLVTAHDWPTPCRGSTERFGSATSSPVSRALCSHRSPPSAYSPPAIRISRHWICPAQLVLPPPAHARTSHRTRQQWPGVMRRVSPLAVSRRLPARSARAAPDPRCSLRAERSLDAQRRTLDAHPPGASAADRLAPASARFARVGADTAVTWLHAWPPPAPGWPPLPGPARRVPRPGTSRAGE